MLLHAGNSQQAAANWSAMAGSYSAAAAMRIARLLRSVSRGARSRRPKDQDEGEEGQEARNVGEATCCDRQHLQLYALRAIWAPAIHSDPAIQAQKKQPGTIFLTVLTVLTTIFLIVDVEAHFAGRLCTFPLFLRYDRSRLGLICFLGAAKKALVVFPASPVASLIAWEIAFIFFVESPWTF